MKNFILLQSGFSKPDEFFESSSTANYFFFFLIIIGVLGLILMFSYYEIKNRITSPEKKVDNLISMAKNISLSSSKKTDFSSRDEIISAIFIYLEKNNYYHYNHLYLRDQIDKLNNDDVMRIYNYLTNNYR